MNTRELLISFFSLFIAAPAAAQEEGPRVELQEGSFLWSRVQNLKGPGALHLERQYDSRSDRRGLFGPGWCWQPEWRLAGSGSSFLLDKCGRPEVLAPRYLRAAHGLWRLRRGSQTLIFGAAHELTAIEEKGVTWFVRRDLAGRPVEIANPARGASWRLRYAEPMSLLISLENGVASFRFEYEKGRLREAWDANRESYRYDDLDNLIWARTAERKPIEVRYDGRRDVVLAVKTSRCDSRYEYDSLETEARVTDRVRETRRCQNARVQITNWSFDYLKTAENSLHLERSAQRLEGGDL